MRIRVLQAAKWLAVVVSLGWASNLVQAADQPPSPEQVLKGLWQRLDANHDNKLDLDEVSAEVVKLARTLDLNGDKSISREELEVAARALGSNINQFVETRREQREERLEAATADVLNRSLPLDGIEIVLESIDQDGNRELTVRETLAALRTGAATVENAVRSRLDEVCRDLREGRCPLKQ